MLSKPWDLERFCELDYVLVSYNGGSFAGATDDALKSLGRTRRVKMSVTHFSLLPELLRQTDFATVAPYHYLKNQTDLVLLEPPFAIAGYHKAMAWHARTHQDPVQKWFRAVMEDVVSGV